MFTKWFSINTGNPEDQCFTNSDVKNFGFQSWKDQVPKCAGGKTSGKCHQSCQTCSQNVGCSGQNCPYLDPSRPFYKFGPLESLNPGGSIRLQPYQFPLPLDYGPSPTINTNILTWARVP